MTKDAGVQNLGMSIGVWFDSVKCKNKSRASDGNDDLREISHFHTSQK